MVGYVGLQLFTFFDTSDEVCVVTLCLHLLTLLCSELITAHRMERVNNVLLNLLFDIPLLSICSRINIPKVIFKED